MSRDAFEGLNVLVLLGTRKDLTFLYSLLSNEVYQLSSPSTVVETHQVYGKCDEIEVVVSHGQDLVTYNIIVRVRGLAAKVENIWSMLDAFRESICEIQGRFSPDTALYSKLLCPISLKDAFPNQAVELILTHRDLPLIPEAFSQQDAHLVIECSICGTVPGHLLRASVSALFANPSAIPLVCSAEDLAGGGTFGGVKKLTDDSSVTEIPSTPDHGASKGEISDSSGRRRVHDG